jgi:cell division transport system ATP-binding protein
MSNKVLSIKNLSLAYKEHIVLKEVNLEIHSSELVYLIGKTGSGKSSLLKAIYADQPVLTGEILIDNFEVHNIKKNQIPFLRRKLGIIFQDFQLLPDRSIGENIAFALRAVGHTDTSFIKQRVMEVLNVVGLAMKVNQMPHQISGGEQQRVAIARGIANQPLLLIADEPTGNLDPEVSEQILELLLNISQKGTSVLIATHDLSLIQKYPSKTFQCHAGKLIEL